VVDDVAKPNDGSSLEDLLTISLLYMLVRLLSNDAIGVVVEYA
jgi:hypothetical protein